MRPGIFCVALALSWTLGSFARSQTARLEWVPVSATGPHTITGNQIVLGNTSGMQVTLELRVSNWDPEHDGVPSLAAIQATVDAAGYNNGSGVNIGPLVLPTLESGAFIALQRCTVGQQINPNGAPCGSGFPACTAGEFCVGNPLYLFDNLNPLAFTALINAIFQNYEFGNVAQVGSKVDDGNTYYLGTLILVVPPTAKGNYTIDFYNDANSNFTFMIDAAGTSIDIAHLVPAVIKIPCITGTACNDSNPCTFDRCSSGTCSNDPRPVGFSCSDGLFCNGAETCDGAKVCVGGSPACTGLPGGTCAEGIGCVGPGNFNQDEFLDLDDWFDFANCITGPEIPASMGCQPAEMDLGTDVDLQDGAIFFNVFTGP